jgi:hypothetical protein
MMTVEFITALFYEVDEQPEFEDHSTHSVEPHRKSKRYTGVVRRVYLGIAGGCGRTFDGKNTRRGLHPELFEVGQHWRR